MLEFDDLTPLDLEEQEKFYDLFWFEHLIEPSPGSALGFAIKKGVNTMWMDIMCMEELIADSTKQDKYLKVVCLLRRYHKGQCLCYHPDMGIISLIPWTY